MLAMGLPDIALRGLTRFAVGLEGAWASERETATYRQREWRGVLRADEPFVAVALASIEGGLAWCRTRWPAASEHEVRVTCSVYGPARRHFNAHFSIADAMVQTFCEIAKAEDGAVEIGAGVLQGGEVQTVARTVDARVSLGVWLIAAADARSARNHTWHLRGAAPEDPESVAGRIFGGRRNGSMSLT